jgi:hypothetical protein
VQVSVSELGPQCPSPASECAPPPWTFRGGGAHSPAGGGGVPIPTTWESLALCLLCGGLDFRKKKPLYRSFIKLEKKRQNVVCFNALKAPAFSAPCYYFWTTKVCNSHTKWTLFLVGNHIYFVRIRIKLFPRKSVSGTRFRSWRV